MEAKHNEMPFLTEIEGKPVLIDPVAVEVIRTIAKENCKKTYLAFEDRILHFKKRIDELNDSQTEVVIVVINVDDKNGEPIAEALMPGFNWQGIRDSGEIPFARGITMRESIQKSLEVFDKEAARALSVIDGTEVVVVVIDHGVAEIFKV